jgi:hypothetical protein
MFTDSSRELWLLLALIYGGGASGIRYTASLPAMNRQLRTPFLCLLHQEVSKFELSDMEK